MYKLNGNCIETDRLILRHFNADDVEDLFEILSDDEGNTFMPWFTIKTIEEAREHLEKYYLSHYGGNFCYRYAICLKENNRAIGYIVITDIGQSNDIGFALNKKYWNRAIMTEAVIALITYLKDIGFTYITATYDKNHTISARIVRRIGMKYCCSYQEFWQPKNKIIVFCKYRLDFS